MRRVILMSAAGLLLISCANVSTPSIAAEKPNIMIMGDDADRDTVPRNSRVFRRVLDALSNQLNEEGFDVYDETAVTLDDFAQGRTRRTDAAARSPSPARHSPDHPPAPCRRLAQPACKPTADA